MEIINQYHAIVGLVPTNPIGNMQRIETVGRCCYQSYNKQTDTSYLPFTMQMIEKKHGAMVEHSNMVIKINIGSDDHYLSEVESIINSKFIFHKVELRYDNCTVYFGGNYRAWMELIQYDGTPFDLFNAIKKYIFEMCGFTAVEVTDQNEILLELKRITVFFRTNRAMCYDDQTEVLTKNGWMYFKNISFEDQMLTFNDTSILYENPTKIINEDYSGDMIVGQSSMVDFCVTPNHRMFWYHYDSRSPEWKINLAEDIEGRRVKFQRGLPFEWVGENIKEDFDNQSSIEFAKFMGIFITDGCINKRKSNGGKIILSQTKKFGRDYIRIVLDNLNFSYYEKSHGFEINDSKLHSFLLKNFPHQDERRKKVCRIPKWILNANKEYISAFIEGVITGDGSVHHLNNHKVIYTCNKELAGDYQECILKIGLCSSIRIDDRIGENHTINHKNITRCNISYVVSITERTNEHLFNKHHWSRIKYNGTIHCVTIPSGMLYVRRNGKCFWSGNSHELVRHRPSSYGQLSQRYVRRNNIAFIQPVGVEMDSRFMEIFIANCKQVEKDYNLLLANYAPQQARNVLTNSVATDIYVTADIPEWMHIFNLRCAKTADPQMQDLMIPVKDDFDQLGWIL